jgi:predicted dehydrogenase
MRNLRVGVIGVGYLGQHHARLYCELPGVTLVGVADSDPIRCQTIAEQYGVLAFPDARELLEEIEAVSIAVPTSAHHTVVKTSLQAGVHVLVEKPIAVNREEALELIDLANRQARVLQVGHIERFNPAIRAVRAHIGRPSFMECYRLGPFGSRGTDVDVVRDLMIHDLDMILSFNLGAIEEVRAAGASVLSSTIDAANARITFESGCMANLTASRVSASHLRELRLYQRDVCISVDYRSRRGTVQRRTVQGNGEPTVFNESGGIEEEPLKLELQSFIHSVSTNTPPAVSGHDGLAALELAHQVLDAIGTFMQRHQYDPSLAFSI